MKTKASLRIAAIGLLTALACAAESPPINLEADEASYNHESGISIYRGNVKVTSGDITLTGDTVEVFASEGEVTKAIASAKPSRFAQRDGDNVLKAEALKIEYHLVDNIIKLTGKVRIIDNDKTFSGEHVIYNIGKKTFVAKKQKKRIKLNLRRARKKE